MSEEQANNSTYVPLLNDSMLDIDEQSEEMSQEIDTNKDIGEGKLSFDHNKL